MIHTFESKRFGKITYDSDTRNLCQDGNIRDVDTRGITNEYIIYSKAVGEVAAKNRCRVRLDNIKGLAYLDILEYVNDSVSQYNYDSFEKAALFVRNAKRSEGHEIFVGGVRFYCYTVEAFAKAYSAVARKKIHVKVHLNDVYFI
jgi:hypothetical protein